VLLCSGLALVAPWAHGTKVEASGATRFSWFAMHPISASIYTAIGFSYLACDVLFVPGAWRRRFVGIPTALLLLPLAAIMVAANSRGPLTALIGALGALVVFRYVRPGAAMALVAGCVLILLAAELSGVTFNSLLNRASRSDSPVAQLVLRGQTPGEFETLTGRTELWTDLVPLLVERPVSGFGYQASRELLLQIRPWAGHAHNALLQTLIDLGLIGTLLLWIPVGRALFVRPHARAPAASFPAWQGATVFTWMVFSLLNAVGDPGFAGPAGYEVTIVLAAIVVAERLAADPLGDPALGAAAQWGPRATRDARILRAGGGFSVAELS
jgi:O-antigen ligase